MDSFHVHLKLSNLKRLGNVIRFIEICVVFIFISRVSFQFQFPVGEYTKKLFSILLSHKFVFVIGNVIVITLFAKSGRDSHPDHTTKPNSTPTDSHNESVLGGSCSTATSTETPGQGATLETERDMHSVLSTERNQSVRVQKPSVQEKKIVNISVLDSDTKPCFKRSYSECLEMENYIKPRRILRRTATEGSGGRCDEVAEALEGYGDGMSDEEFRVMVETFIAKQQRSLREEEKYLSFR